MTFETSYTFLPEKAIGSINGTKKVGSAYRCSSSLHSADRCRSSPRRDSSSRRTTARNSHPWLSRIAEAIDGRSDRQARPTIQPMSLRISDAAHGFFHPHAARDELERYVQSSRPALNFIPARIQSDTVPGMAVKKQRRCEEPSAYVEMSVMPFPMRTLWRLMAGRPSSSANRFRSQISPAKTGRYRPYKSTVNGLRLSSY